MHAAHVLMMGFLPLKGTRCPRTKLQIDGRFGDGWTGWTGWTCFGEKLVPMSKTAPSAQDYFDRIGLFSKSFTQSIWLSFGAMRWLLLVAIGLGAGLVSCLR